MLISKPILKSVRKSPAQTPYTPAVPLFYALQEALHMAKEEGFAARRARTAKQAEAVRAAAKALGIELFPKVNEHSHYSNTVTAMKMPEGITDDKLRGGMKKQGVIVSGGQEKLKGKIFRIGTMGICSQGDVLRTIQTLELVLAKEGRLAERGAGVEAASKASGSLNDLCLLQRIMQRFSNIFSLKKALKQRLIKANFSYSNLISRVVKDGLFSVSANIHFVAFIAASIASFQCSRYNFLRAIRFKQKNHLM